MQNPNRDDRIYFHIMNVQASNNPVYVSKVCKIIRELTDPDDQDDRRVIFGSMYPLEDMFESYTETKKRYEICKNKYDFEY